MLKYERKKATGTSSRFLALFFFFCILGSFWPYLVLAKKCIFFKKHLKKMYLLTLTTKVVALNYTSMLHISKI